MSNPNEDQWNGQTGQPNQSQPNQPNPAGQPGQPQYGAYDSNHAANILRKVRRERKTLRISMRRTASHKANRTRTRTTARTPTIRTMARTASRHGGRTVGGIRRTANRIAKRTGSEWSMGRSKSTRLAADQRYVGISVIRLIEDAAGKSQDQDSHHLRRGGRGRHRLGAALLLVPNKTLALAALLLGVYFVISGVVRIVSALVEPGLPGGWRVLDVFVGILLTFWRRGGCAQLRHDRSDAGITHYFDGRFRMDYGRRAVAG